MPIPSGWIFRPRRSILFPRKADRIHLSERVNDITSCPIRTRPMDLEVHSISEVVGFGTNSDVRRPFGRFMPAPIARPARKTRPITPYIGSRAPTLAKQRAQGPRSVYSGAKRSSRSSMPSKGPYHPAFCR